MRTGSRKTEICPGSASKELDKNTVFKITRDILTPAQLKGSFIFWDKRIHEEGEKIGIELQPVSMPFRGTMVFVDLAPAYNWAHPCLYIFIDCLAEKTHLMKASFPPFIGPPDENYVILLRFGDIPPHERYFAVFDRDKPLKKGTKNETE
jgi:hypothetical protein